jgi:hypothetical protein
LGLSDCHDHGGANEAGCELSEHEHVLFDEEVWLPGPDREGAALKAIPRHGAIHARESDQAVDH